jgi:transcriptional repressor NrdR
VDSRLAGAEDCIRRRRVCEGCGGRFTTYERVEMRPVLVVKKDGRRERFERDKLARGLHKALHRRPISAEIIDGFVAEVERALSEQGLREVASAELGRMVMAFLRRTDHVAYVRFASVYREFHDVSCFVTEVSGLAAPPSAEEGGCGDQQP